MKILRLLALIAMASLTQSSFAQAGTTFNEAGGLERSVVTNARKAETATGSQYFSEVFVPANVKDKGITLIRYNAYTDQIEYKNNLDKVSPLPSEKDVIITTTDKRNAFEYLDYTTDENENISGYLNLISNNDKVKIYSRLRVFLQDATEPTSGYTTYKPANYKKASTKYFIRIKEKSVVALPTRKKDLISMFPGKDKEIAAFIKENKISLSEEEDLKKLGEYLNTLS